MNIEPPGTFHIIADDKAFWRAFAGAFALQANRIDQLEGCLKQLRQKRLG
jgi:hypothetical protein